MVIAVFVELISAHKKSLASQETCSKVSSSFVKSAAVGDDLSSLVKKECATNESYSAHRTATSTQMSVLPIPNPCTKYTCEGHLNADRVATNLPDDGAQEMMKGDNDNAAHSNRYRLCTSDVQSDKVSETQSKTLRRKNSRRVLDVSSALAAEMVSLYRSKVLPKSCSDASFLSSSSPSPRSAIRASPANSRIESCRILQDVTGVDIPCSSVMQHQRTVATKVPLVSKSPFKLVSAKTVRSSSCRGETLLPQVLKSVQTEARIDRIGRNIPGKITQFSTLTSCSSHSDSRPCSTLVNATRAVSCSSAVPLNLSRQITVAVSSSTNAVTKTSNCATVSSLKNFIHEKSANPKVNFTSSKYKLVRRREFACRNASRQTPTTPLNDTSVTTLVPHRAVKHTPTLLVVNKYKLVRKKQSTFTPSARRTPLDVKKMAPSMKSSPGILSPICRNGSASHLKTRSSRYKLVRKNDQSCSPVFKKPSTRPAFNRADNKVQVLSKYKLVQRKSTTVSRTPQRAAATLADNSQHFTHTRSPYNKHITPPLFLNKYKLIRKRSLLKTRSPHCMMRSRKPSAERHKHLYSRRRHSLTETLSPNKKRGIKKQSFLSKYALQRSGKGR